MLDSDFLSIGTLFGDLGLSGSLKTVGEEGWERVGNLEAKGEQAAEIF